ncbi:MAG: phosphotransferase [Halofilum sp. (in: g-proteobacteria)]
MTAPDREHALAQWIAGQRGDAIGPWQAASSDASFRRYFRIPVDDGALIAMDAPPEHEDARPFVAIATRLRSAGVHVPRVLASDLERGFVLMEDLGAVGFIDRLQGTDADQPLMDAAIASLVHMQAHTPHGDLPGYDAALLRRELDLFPEWYVRRHLGVDPDADWWAAWEMSCRALIDNALAQTRVFVHRDYMARNLMVTTPNPGVLDFQDAVSGPVSYDPICLLRDAFLSWPAQLEDEWLRRYHGAASAAGLPLPEAFDDFRGHADRMAAQRHLKVLGIFARLRHRDGKPDYIADAPRFLDYLARETADYADLTPLRELLQALPAEPRP